MTDFRTLQGNIFDSHAQVLVNPINCVGAMGKGLSEYRRQCQGGLIRIGEVRFHRVSGSRTVVNLPTKQ